MEYLAALNVYSVTVAIFILAAYVEAGILELCKNAMANWEDKHRAQASSILAFVLSLACVLMIWFDPTLPHPGSIAVLPIYFGTFFLLQYFADFKGGMKAVVGLLTAKKEEKPKKEKAPRARYARFAVDENGKPIV